MTISPAMHELLIAHEAMSQKYYDCIAFIKRVKHMSCCLVCCDECLACDAQQLLMEMEIKNEI